MTEQDFTKLLGWPQAKQHIGTDDVGVSNAQIALNVNQFAAWLIRTNYVIKVGKLIPASWAVMSETELTATLSKKFTEAQLEAMFSKSSELRQLLKNRARNFTLVAAVVVALIWCKEDLDSGEYLTAGAKFSLTVGGAYVLNQYFYGRDKTALTIMAKHMGNFGKWFKGVARTNIFVNYLTRRLIPALLVWDLRGILMSSGSMGGPNIPFDFIIYIDIFDKSTWSPPPEGGLDWGLDFFYYQKPTEHWPVGYQQACLGVIRGSLLRAPKRWLGLAYKYNSKGLLTTSAETVRSPANGGAKVKPGPIGIG